jgi:hypothetical protein
MTPKRTYTDPSGTSAEENPNKSLTQRGFVILIPAIIIFSKGKLPLSSKD